MKHTRILMALAALWVFFGAAATPPIEYNAAVRNGEGDVIADMPVKFILEITDAASEGNSLYSETQTVTTDAVGIARLMVGEGTPVDGDFEAIDWSAPRYLSVTVEVSGDSRRLGTMQLLGAPLARQARTASALTRTTPTGEVLELTVSNLGELHWKGLPNTDQPSYDQNKVPQQLYFIGTFNNWQVDEAVEMTKLSPTRFSIDRYLSSGEVFKFVAYRQWTNLDWSGTDIKIGEPVPLKELGNTPPFYYPEGEYTITVDFYNFTMLITKK